MIDSWQAVPLSVSTANLVQINGMGPQKQREAGRSLGGAKLTCPTGLFRHDATELSDEQWPGVTPIVPAMVQKVCKEVWDEGKHPPSLPLLCCPFASPGGFALAQTRLRISAVTWQLAADRILSSPWAPAPSVRAPGRTLWRGPFLNPPVPAVVCALQP